MPETLSLSEVGLDAAQQLYNATLSKQGHTNVQALNNE